MLSTLKDNNLSSLIAFGDTVTRGKGEIRHNLSDESDCETDPTGI